MKRKNLLKLTALGFVVVTALVTVFATQRKHPDHDLIMQNIEVLTQTEDYSGETCYNIIEYKKNCTVLYCGDCSKITPNSAPTGNSTTGVCSSN